MQVGEESILHKTTAYEWYAQENSFRSREWGDWHRRWERSITIVYIFSVSIWKEGDTSTKIFDDAYTWPAVTFTLAFVGGCIVLCTRIRNPYAVATDLLSLLTRAREALPSLFILSLSHHPATRPSVESKTISRRELLHKAGHQKWAEDRLPPTDIRHNMLCWASVCSRKKNESEITRKTKTHMKWEQVQSSFKICLPYLHTLHSVSFLIPSLLLFKIVFQFIFDREWEKESKKVSVCVCVNPDKY